VVVGSRTMKVLGIISLGITLTCMSLFAHSASLKSKKVDVKCHVELVGGGETVAFWNISEKRLQGFHNKLRGKKVLTTLSSDKKTIYQAFECVPLKESFTSFKAKNIDEKTAR